MMLIGYYSLYVIAYNLKINIKSASMLTLTVTKFIAMNLNIILHMST